MRHPELTFMGIQRFCDAGRIEIPGFTVKEAIPCVGVDELRL
jgi:hypothetical protein